MSVRVTVRKKKTGEKIVVFSADAAELLSTGNFELLADGEMGRKISIEAAKLSVERVPREVKADIRESNEAFAELEPVPSIVKKDVDTKVTTFSKSTKRKFKLKDDASEGAEITASEE